MKIFWIAFALFCSVSCDEIRLPNASAARSPGSAPDRALLPPPLAIVWDDADSGRINGRRFRVSHVDAPETGGVDAAVGAARCEAERAAGVAARDWATSFTKGATIAISRDHGLDRMPEPRLLVELSVNGTDYAAAGVAAGHLRPWPHDGTRALAPKPDWCATTSPPK
jgi:endonuclease YncB( thermonuclease family)